MYDFHGCVAVVTGAAQGIGREIALRLSREGAILALLDIHGKGLEETADLISVKGGQALPVVTDVSDASAVQRAVDQTIQTFGDIRFLVNVAGIGQCSPFLDVLESDWDRTLDVNLKGTFLTCQIVGKYMVARREGRIVNIASIAGKTGSEILVPYSASKGGVILLTQAVARALAPFGVTVNAVCPGLVWTPMWRVTATWMGENDPNFKGRGLSPDEVYNQVVKAITPMRQPTTTQDIASAVAFLLSDEARMITGQALNVDGGIELH